MLINQNKMDNYNSAIIAQNVNSCLGSLTAPDKLPQKSLLYIILILHYNLTNLTIFSVLLQIH